MTLPVILVLPFGVVGGAERWALGILDAGPALDVEAVVLGDGPLVAVLRDRGVPVSVLPTGPHPLAIAATSLRLTARFRRSAPGTVVWANGIKSAAAAAPAGRLARTPVVWAKHDRSFDTRLARPLGRLVSRVVAVSDDIAAPVGRPDTVVVPPPLPSRPAEPADAAARFWAERLPAGPQRWAATVGRLVSYKGIDTAIRALAEPAAAGWGLAVVGEEDPAEPGERARLARLAADLGVADRVAFTGAVPDAGRWFAGLDAVLVLTGRDAAGFGGEGWSTVALEALWAGVPLVGTPEGAPVAAATGEVVAPGDAAAVAEALARLGTPDARAHARRAGPAALAEHPDRGQVADRFVAVLTAAGAPGRRR